MASSSAAAETFEKRVRVSGYVPVECEAGLRPALQPVSADSFRLGVVRQFCNTPFQMTLRHPVVNSDATLRFKSAVAPVTAGETIISSWSSAADDTADLFVQGLSEADATMFAAGMTLSVTPLGV